MATYIMECGGMERIEQLQMHDNNSIYNKVRINMKTRSVLALSRCYRPRAFDFLRGSRGWLFIRLTAFRERDRLWRGEPAVRDRHR